MLRNVLWHISQVIRVNWTRNCLQQVRFFVQLCPFFEIKSAKRPLCLGCPPPLSINNWHRRIGHWGDQALQKTLKGHVSRDFYGIDRTCWVQTGYWPLLRGVQARRQSPAVPGVRPHPGGLLDPSRQARPENSNSHVSRAEWRGGGWCRQNSDGREEKIKRKKNNNNDGEWEWERGRMEAEGGGGGGRRRRRRRRKRRVKMRKVATTTIKRRKRRRRRITTTTITTSKTTDRMGGWWWWAGWGGRGRRRRQVGV